MSELARLLEQSAAGGTLRRAVGGLDGQQMAPQGLGVVERLAAQGALDPRAMEMIGVQPTARRGRRGRGRVSAKLKELMAQGMSRREAIAMLAESGQINPRFVDIAADVVSPAREILDLP